MLENIGNNGSYNKFNGIDMGTSNLQLIEKEKLDGFGAVSLNNNNNNNNNNKQSNKNKNNNNNKEYSHIEKVKEKRRQVLARHNVKVLCPSLHNKNNNNRKNNKKNDYNNNNNNNEMTMLNDLLDDNLTPNSSFDSSISGISSLKENNESIGNQGTYRGINGISIKSSNLQWTRDDLGDLDAGVSSFTNMVCNDKEDKNTELDELEENLDKNKQIGNDSDDESMVSTSSTDAVLRDSEMDDDDVNPT